ncbi:MAG: AP-endonuc-2 domain-containing protein [Succiniclasticum sp.]
MLELVNISNYPMDVDNILQGNRRTLPSFLKRHHLDGIELLLGPALDRHFFPVSQIQGVHLQFYPNWVDFWKGNDEAVLASFGDQKTVEQTFGRSRDEWLERQRENMRAAGALGAKYVVYHVSNARMDEIYTRHHHYGDDEVIEAQLEVSREIVSALPEDCLLLYENLWWPGLTFCRPDLAARLLEGTPHENTGFLLDSGHLMCTNWSLRDEQEAVDYVLRRYAALGELRHRVYGMHLHRSLSGKVAAAVQRHPPRQEREGFDWMACYRYMKEVDRHEPFRTEAVRRLVETIAPQFLTHEFLMQSLAEWEDDLSQQQLSLWGNAMGRENKAGQRNFFDASRAFQVDNSR